MRSCRYVYCRAIQRIHCLRARRWNVTHLAGTSSYTEIPGIHLPLHIYILTWRYDPFHEHSRLAIDSSCPEAPPPVPQSPVSVLHRRRSVVTLVRRCKHSVRKCEDSVQISRAAWVIMLVPRRPSGHLHVRTEGCRVQTTCHMREKCEKAETNPHLVREMPKKCYFCCLLPVLNFV